MIKKLSKIEYILFSLLCIVSVFAFSNSMTDTYIVPKWCYTILVFVLYLIVISIKSLYNKILNFNVLTMSYIIVVVCTFQALYGISQWLQLVRFDNKYGITGSFDNPAGFAVSLCIGLPFILLCIKSISSRFWIFVMQLLALLFIFAIVISESRSGMIGGMAIICVELCKRLPIRINFKVIITCCLFISLLFGSYFLKKDSADGRLLIWNCSWRMIIDSPMYGHGFDAFRAHYMDYQANYLSQYPNNEYAMLADNVISPFNEYLNVALSCGFLGVLILVFGVLFLIVCYYKDYKYEKRVALLSLLGIAVFSMFSYPLKYPFVWIVMYFDVYVILRGSFIWVIPSLVKRILCVVAIIAGMVVFYKLCMRIDAEYKWNAIAYFPTNENVRAYKDLMPILGDDPYFLYNYAVALYGKGCLEESLNVALQCRTYWADYDLELLLGDIYLDKNEHIEAESHYRKASFMCPSRFTPLYKIYSLYRRIGDGKEATAMAQLILEKPIKIQSNTIDFIKAQVRRDLELK